MSVNTTAPDNTAVRVALWRALHTEIDQAPHILEDTAGLQLAAPEEGWQQRPDMHPIGTRTFRLSIVSRARFIEDLVSEQLNQGVTQYVILGAGLDTFAQRRNDIASQMTVFEVDQPGTQEWKKNRLIELGLGIPEYLRFVPVNFEAGDSWWAKLLAAGFNPQQPAILASTGVSMYLTQEAVAAMLKQATKLAPGSTFAMSYILPIELCDPDERPSIEMAIKGARASGTPFLSFFNPEEIQQLAKEAGFKNVRNISADDLSQRYFANRTDGLHPSKSEQLLVVGR